MIGNCSFPTEKGGIQVRGETSKFVNVFHGILGSMIQVAAALEVEMTWILHRYVRNVNERYDCCYFVSAS